MVVSSRELFQSIFHVEIDSSDPLLYDRCQSTKQIVDAVYGLKGIADAIFGTPGDQKKK